jgi:hypothetical protein
MTNEPNKTDFFPVSDEQLKDLTVSYQDTEEDFRHKEYLKELEATIFENSDAVIEEDLGELPFDAEADRQRWDELEKDFDRVFDEAKNKDY